MAQVTTVRLVGGNKRVFVSVEVAGQWYNIISEGIMEGYHIIPISHYCTLPDDDTEMEKFRNVSRQYVPSDD